MQIQNDENELQKAIDDIAKNAAAEDSGAVSELDAKVQDQLGVPPVPEVDATIPEVPDMPVVPSEGVGDLPAGAGELPSGSGELPMPGGESLTVAGDAATSQDAGPVAPDAPLEIDESTLPEIKIKEDAPVSEAGDGSESVAEGEASADTDADAPGAPDAPVDTSAEPEKAEETPVEEAKVEVNAAVGSGDFKDVKAAALKDLYPLLDKISVNAEQKCKIYREAYEATGDKEIIPKLYEAIKGIEDERLRAEQLLYVVGL